MDRLPAALLGGTVGAIGGGLVSACLGVDTSDVANALSTQATNLSGVDLYGGLISTDPTQANGAVLALDPTTTPDSVLKAANLQHGIGFSPGAESALQMADKGLSAEEWKQYLLDPTHKAAVDELIIQANGSKLPGVTIIGQDTIDYLHLFSDANGADKLLAFDTSALKPAEWTTLPGQPQLNAFLQNLKDYVPTPTPDAAAGELANFTTTVAPTASVPSWTDRIASKSTLIGAGAGAGGGLLMGGKKDDPEAEAGFVQQERQRRQLAAMAAMQGHSNA